MLLNLRPKTILVRTAHMHYCQPARMCRGCTASRRHCLLPQHSQIRTVCKSQRQGLPSYQRHMVLLPRYHHKNDRRGMPHTHG